MGPQSAVRHCFRHGDPFRFLLPWTAGHRVCFASHDFEKAGLVAAHWPWRQRYCWPWLVLART